MWVCRGAKDGWGNPHVLLVAEAEREALSAAAAAAAAALPHLDLPDNWEQYGAAAGNVHQVEDILGVANKGGYRHSKGTKTKRSAGCGCGDWPVKCLIMASCCPPLLVACLPLWPLHSPPFT